MARRRGWASVTCIPVSSSGGGTGGHTGAEHNGKCVGLLHAGSLPSQGTPVRSSMENSSEWSHSRGVLQMGGEKRQVFTYFASKCSLLGIF